MGFGEISQNFNFGWIRQTLLVESTTHHTPPSTFCARRGSIFSPSTQPDPRSLDGAAESTVLIPYFWMIDSTVPAQCVSRKYSTVLVVCSLAIPSHSVHRFDQPNDKLLGGHQRQPRQPRRQHHCFLQRNTQRKRYTDNQAPRCPILEESLEGSQLSEAWCVLNCSLVKLSMDFSILGRMTKTTSVPSMPGWLTNGLYGLLSLSQRKNASAAQSTTVSPISSSSRQASVAHTVVYFCVHFCSIVYRAFSCSFPRGLPEVSIVILGRRGNPHQRSVVIDTKNRFISWRKGKKIYFSDIVSVKKGKVSKVGSAVSACFVLCLTFHTSTAKLISGTGDRALYARHCLYY